MGDLMTADEVLPDLDLMPLSQWLALDSLSLVHEGRSWKVMVSDPHELLYEAGLDRESFKAWSDAWYGADDPWCFEWHTYPLVNELAHLSTLWGEAPVRDAIRWATVAAKAKGQSWNYGGGHTRVGDGKALHAATHWARAGFGVEAWAYLAAGLSPAKARKGRADGSLPFDGALAMATLAGAVPPVGAPVGRVVRTPDPSLPPDVAAWFAERWVIPLD